MERLNEAEQKFIQRAISRKRLFLVLSVVSIIIAIGLSVIYTWKAIHQQNFKIGTHFVIILLILLSARQNLRQYKYAKILEKIFTDKII